MRSVLLIARVGVAVLLLCLIVSALTHVPKFVFFGLGAAALLAAAVDALNLPV